MFCDYLHQFNLLNPFLKHKLWQKSLTWLKDEASKAILGNHEFGESGWFANVHTYKTLPISDCVWESHEHTIDIQYLIYGEEKIQWAPEIVFNKSTPIVWRTDIDRLEWANPSQEASMLRMYTGMFTIFLPGEPHRPMIALKNPLIIRKAVVKIPIQLFEVA